MTQPIVPIFVPSPSAPNYIDGDLEVAGDALIDNNLTVKGVLTINTINPANISTNGTLYVGGASTLNGNVTTNNLTVNGTLTAATFNPTSLTLSGNLTVDGNSILGTGSSYVHTVNNVLDDGTGILTTSVPSVTGTATTISQMICPNMTTGGSCGFRVGHSVNNYGGTRLGFSFVGGSGSTSNLAQLGVTGGGMLTVSGTGAVACPATLSVTGNTQLGTISGTNTVVTSKNTLDDGSGNVTLAGGLSVAGNSRLGVSAGSDAAVTSHNTLDDGSGNVSIAGNLTGTVGIFTGILYANGAAGNSGTAMLFEDNSGAGNYLHLQVPNLSSANNFVVLPASPGTLALTTQIPTVPITVVFSISSAALLTLVGTAKGFSVGGNTVSFPANDGNTYLITALVNALPTGSPAVIQIGIQTHDTNGSNTTLTNATPAPSDAVSSISNSITYVNNTASAELNLTYDANITSMTGTVIVTQIL